MLRFPKLLAGAVALTISAASLSAQGVQSFEIRGFAGVMNSPAEFDAFREVNYDTGIRFGAGLNLVFDEHLAIRGMFARISQTGHDITAGVIDQPVDFTRTYYSVALELTVPAFANFSPYIVGGGGIVHLNRDAEEYWYQFSEFAGVGGLGVSYRFAASNFSAFVEGLAWIYKRQSLGETQVDNLLNAGVSYSFSFR